MTSRAAEPRPPPTHGGTQDALATRPARGDERPQLSLSTRPTVVALLAGTLVWEIAGQALRFSFLPPFSRVVRALVELASSGLILGHLRSSLGSLTLGYATAVTVGVGLGLLMGRFRWLNLVLMPYINALFVAPKLVFVPLFFALFGTGRGTQVAVVFLSSVFVILVNTASGVRDVKAHHIDMARVFGASERQVFIRVLIPGALPLLMAGLRLGMGRAVKGMISGEMFIAVFGLGGLLRTYGGRFDSERVFAVLMVVVGLALLCNGVLRAIERHVISWTEPQ
jgi:ABC-type nitrate/sulfonate/bicarbonate transport system permease component